MEGGNWRVAAIRRKSCGLKNNFIFNAGGNFNPDYRGDHWSSAGGGFHLSVGNHRYRAAVIVGNRSAVQPHVQRRANFRRRHNDPEAQR